ncbi:hypothetical protein ANCCAN_18261, partial [Ancylostoma caninum]
LFCRCTNTTIEGNITCETTGYSASDRWNIYGDRSWIKGTVQSFYYVGHMVGSFFWGILSDKWEQLLTSESKKHTSAGLIDLFRTPEIRKRTLVCFFVWPVNAMMYYGLTMKSDLAGGDLHINFAFSAAVEIVACVFVFFLIDRVGRRIIVAGSFLIAGICLLLNWLIGDNGECLKLLMMV